MNKTVKERLALLIGERALDALLAPWRMFYWWKKTRISPRKNKALVAKFLAQSDVVKVELGSPKRPELSDWIATDINGDGDIKIDFTKPLPFPECSVDNIYSSHILEHFSYPRPMLPFLKECYRIMKAGAEFSIAVPDAEIFVNAYLRPAEFDKGKYCSWDVGLSYKSPIDYLNFVAYLGGEHKHLFDRRNLIDILEEAGFRNVHVRAFDPELDLVARRHESIYALGVK